MSRIFIRGGSWNSTPAGVRSAYRDWSNPDVRYNDQGFRLVLRKIA